MILNTPIIDARGISRRYSGGGGSVDALVNADIALERASFTAIIGSSGSGKSTLMNILGCLDKPTGGTYRLNGESVTDASPEKLAELRRAYIGFIFQRFHLIPRLTAEENVALPLLYRHISRDDIAEKANDALLRVGLSARAKHRPGEMSGGQMQRVAIARAIITEPEILLADEPTGNLDPEASSQILDLLEGLRREGKTVVLITHDLQAARRADSLYRIVGGRLTRA
ncbi:MAG: ABC transporter ATP-binding protein [Clostridia bacterium]|nr:ABC transporter ATP-binding protein [Clostridia bacterium]